jgi:hypothetical protein
MNTEDMKWFEDRIMELHKKIDLIMDVLNVVKIQEAKKELLRLQEKISKPRLIVPGPKDQQLY